MAVLLSACSSRDAAVEDLSNFVSITPPQPVIRQPVLPEMLKVCRGHVLVPALGMKFIARGAPAPETGQFVREESVSAPYRVIRPGSRMTQENSPSRLNLELDQYGRLIGLYCG
jgi:hypothetical protein